MLRDKAGSASGLDGLYRWWGRQAPPTRLPDKASRLGLVGIPCYVLRMGRIPAKTDLFYISEILVLLAVRTRSRGHLQRLVFFLVLRGRLTGA